MADSVLKQYWSLTKPRVVALIVFTAVIGMFLAVPGLPPLRQALLFGTFGIWLAASSAAAINQLLDSASTRRWRARRGDRWSREP